MTRRNIFKLLTRSDVFSLGQLEGTVRVPAQALTLEVVLILNRVIIVDSIDPFRCRQGGKYRAAQSSMG